MELKTVLIYQSYVMESLSSLPEMLLSSFPCIFQGTERIDFLNGMVFKMWICLLVLLGILKGQDVSNRF